MLRYAVDAGVNLVNLVYSFDDIRRERIARIVNQALQDGYWEKVRIATTLPALAVREAKDIDRFLDDVTGWLDTGRIDLFRLEGLDRDSWPRLREAGILDRFDKALAGGRIGQAGFGFHDQFHYLRDVIAGYERWSFGSFQFSFMDEDHHPGVSGLAYAANQDLGVVVTDPLKGGNLVKTPPESVAAVWAEAPVKRPVAEWALRWVWNHAEVATVVSDMATMEQVKENIAVADAAAPGNLGVMEQVLVSRVRDAYRRLRPVPCTACRHCMPCSPGIDVPRIFEIYNDAVMYDDADTARSIFRIEGHDLDDFAACGDCAAACGRQIPVVEWLRQARELLEND